MAQRAEGVPRTKGCMIGLLLDDGVLLTEEGIWVMVQKDLALFA